MVEINLLPWRVYSLEYEKKKFIQYATALFFLLIVFLIPFVGLNIPLQAKSHAVLHLKKELCTIQPMKKQHQDEKPIFNIIKNFEKRFADFRVKWIDIFQ